MRDDHDDHAPRGTCVVSGCPERSLEKGVPPVARLRLLAGELVQVLNLRRRVVDTCTDHVRRTLGRQEVAHLALRLRPSGPGEVVLDPTAVWLLALDAIIGGELVAWLRAVGQDLR